tara:strand:- start:1953 stop:2795 length:843 start_codon:yes stop_codon:yes gene_type:complete
MNLQSALNEGREFLKNKNIKNSKLDSEILMSKIINKDRKFIILNNDYNLSYKSFVNFKELVNQRSKGKPIAYLTGKKNFWKYDFEISQNVLIPRPDTELLIEQILEITKNKLKLNILDIGVGSGCILISVLKEKKDFRGTGIDISKKCLDLSRINACKFGVNNRIKFVKSDIDNFNYGKYDLIISNPPYIKKLDLFNLRKNSIRFEPIIALNGGIDGTSIISKVINKSSKLIKKNGKLVLEIAYDQKDKVKKKLNKKGFYINKILKDLGNNYRCIISTKL